MLRSPKPLIYIDGEAGTTGLLLQQLLKPRADLELLQIDPDRRKDPSLRRELFARADATILCLPDDAAIEAVKLAAPTGTRLLDASSAHRVREDWVYGLPELAPEQRASIRNARWVSNPGCYPTAVILLLRPLVEARFVSPEAPIAIHALSGYSGGGRKLIERWESPERDLNRLPFEAPYALEQEHKHLPEMARYVGLSRAPHFVPAVGPFRQGMRVQIPLHQALLGPGATAMRVHQLLCDRYSGERFVTVRPLGDGPGDEIGLDPRRYNGKNRIELGVVGNPLGHLLLFALLDNLGKGAAGAAAQNLNLMLGLEETQGLEADLA